MLLALHVHPKLLLLWQCLDSCSVVVFCSVLCLYSFDVQTTQRLASSRWLHVQPETVVEGLMCWS
jgi:hypothetical protein